MRTTCASSGVWGRPKIPEPGAAAALGSKAAGMVAAEDKGPWTLSNDPLYRNHFRALRRGGGRGWGGRLGRPAQASTQQPPSTIEPNEATAGTWRRSASRLGMALEL